MQWCRFKNKPMLGKLSNQTKNYIYIYIFRNKELTQHNILFRKHSEKSSVVFLTTKIKEKLCFYNCCKSAHLWWYKKVNIACIKCGRVYYINKRKDAIRISLLFVFEVLLDSCFCCEFYQYQFYRTRLGTRVVYYHVISWWDVFGKYSIQ